MWLMELATGNVDICWLVPTQKNIEISKYIMEGYLRCSFGNFQPKHRPARKARNPKTQEVLEVPPQTVPTFNASKMFKEKVNQLAPSIMEKEEQS